MRPAISVTPSLGFGDDEAMQLWLQLTDGVKNFSVKFNQTIKQSTGLVTVRATRFDGADHWVHPATLIRASTDLVVTQTSAGLDISRGNGKVFTSPYNTNGHYWPDRWFNVIRLEVPGQGLYGYYCNIATPLQFDGATVAYVDLQLDVIARVTSSGGLTYWLADEDEFEEARDRYGYDDALIERCYAAVKQCGAMIERREFPFDVRP